MRFVRWFAVTLLLGGCAEQRPTESRQPTLTTKGPKSGASNVTKVPDDMKNKLIDQALAAVRDSGRSTEGLDIRVSEWRESWMVWFTPHDLRSDTEAFVVKIDKDGKSPPRILKTQ